MDGFQKGIIQEFWKWVLAHQDNETVVEYDGNRELCIWVDTNDLEEFVDRYIADSESRLEATIFNGHIYIKLIEFLGGYGFSMNDVWELRPNNLVQNF
ncbi:hypothetical protein [Anaerovorax sp. IOR16]|uniref:hypothetical protein n=1 Tax=Anaerovorax sp. IOR16 TaxID=2773458 RepID=UPI0019D23C7B|nr:hypothetical protein [Anaerovorax sp. IOR16]